MQNTEIYKYIGLLASFTAWLAIAVVLYVWPTEKSKSISKHVAAYKKAWLLFAPIETLALFLFYVFMIKWFIPSLELGAVYEILVTLALALELVTTWVPDTTGIKHKIHQYTAYGAVILLPALNILITISSIAPTATRVATGISTTVMLSIIVKYLVGKNTRENHLLYQSIYFACFHIPLLVTIITVD